MKKIFRKNIFSKLFMIKKDKKFYILIKKIFNLKIKHKYIK